MKWELIVIFAFFGIAVIGTINIIGEKREPVTPRDAIQSLILVSIILYLISRL